MAKEVRFSKEYELRDLIYQGVSETLQQANLTYQLKIKQRKEKYLNHSLIK